MCAWFIAAGHVAEGTRQSFTQLQARAQETDLHVGLGEAERPGGLPGRKILHVPEQEDGTVARIELGDGGIEQATRFSAAE